MVKTAKLVNSHNATSLHAGDRLLLQKLTGFKQTLSILANYYSEEAIEINYSKTKQKSLNI